MPFTEQDVIDMEDASRLLQQKRQQQFQVQRQIDLDIALAWFNTLGINIQSSTTRTQAKIIHDEIEQLLKIETDAFRRGIINQKLNEANEKYIAVKKVNPNS